MLTTMDVAAAFQRNELIVMGRSLSHAGQQHVNFQ